VQRTSNYIDYNCVLWDIVFVFVVFVSFFQVLKNNNIYIYWPIYKELPCIGQDFHIGASLFRCIRKMQCFSACEVKESDHEDNMMSLSAVTHNSRIRWSSQSSSL